MGDFFRQQYGELPLLYEKLYNEELAENYYEDSSKYIPRIEGTELELGITFLSFNYLPILTSRKKGRKVKYYLFDFIKILEVVE